MADSKNILIISFTFPPAPGIGGRRWAKFAKYLQRRGHKVYVVAGKSESNEISDWTRDIEGLDITYLDSRLPGIILHPSRAKAGGLRFRLATLWLKLKVKGNYYDKSAVFSKDLSGTVSKIIREKRITHVISSGAPFRMLSTVLKLKPSFPNVKFITDFRDVWTTDDSISNFKMLSPARINYEKEMEKEVVNASDLVISVAGPITDYFKGRCTNRQTRFDVLENGFDPDDFSNLPDSGMSNSDPTVKIVFTGTLYPEMENLWYPLVDALAEFKKSKPELYARFRFEFFGNIKRSYIDYAQSMGMDHFHFHGKVPLNRVFSEIRSSTFCLLILHDLFVFSLSTKFCEYLSQQKKIIVLSREGETAKFVERNRIGFWLDPENIPAGLARLARAVETGEDRNWDTGLDISYYSVESLTIRLEKFLEGLGE